MREEEEIILQIDPILKALLNKVEKKLKNSSIQKEVDEFKKEIIKKPAPPEQIVSASIPHQMAKRSVFFPIPESEVKREIREIKKREHETVWGKIVIEGNKLAIFEEDIFLALMKIAKGKININNDLFVLKTNSKDILDLLYGKSEYAKKFYDRIESALKHFQLVRFELTTFNWIKKDKKRQRTRTVRSIGNIVRSYNYETETKDLTIYFNPMFFAYFLESMLTNIDFATRKKLKKDESKALLRVLSAHNKPVQMHVIEVLRAINYDKLQPLILSIKKVKELIRELKRHGVLGKKTKFQKHEMIYFDILPRKK